MKVLNKLLLGLFWVLSVNATAEQLIKIEDAWVRAMPPVAKSTAAYMTIKNHSNKTVKIGSVSTTQFTHAHIHNSVLENGLMTMMSVGKQSVPANGLLELKPGGLHIMLMMPKEKLTAGDSVELAIKWEDGTESKVVAVVK